MNKITSLFRSFRTQVTVILVLATFFALAASNLLIYEYFRKAQFEWLRNELMIIAQTVALSVDAERILQIQPGKAAVDTPQYRITEKRLLNVREVSSSIVYIYILRKTDKEGILKFIIDLRPALDKAQKAPAFPGDEYEASRFPEMLNGFNGPSADKKIVTDEWGIFLSGYAPIRDSNGNAVAILGIDISAKDVYEIQKQVRILAVLALIFGVLLSMAVGLLISGRVTTPIKKLAQGTRHIARGDLEYRVKIRGAAEIMELAAAFNSMAKNLDESRKNLLNYFYRVVQSLVRILEARDPYTKGHSDRVAEYSEKIAVKMGLAKEKIELLKEAALLHDIGKLGIQEVILNKSVQLDDDEWEMIQRHPALGEEILKPVSPDEEMLAVVREHHERYDGTGYPDHLKGDHIDLLASIVSVADSYDAMTSHRTYRTDLSKREVIEQFKKNKGSQFNPKVVEAFLEILQEDPKV